MLKRELVRLIAIPFEFTCKKAAIDSLFTLR